MKNRRHATLLSVLCVLLLLGTTLWLYYEKNQREWQQELLPAPTPSADTTAIAEVSAETAQPADPDSLDWLQATQTNNLDAYQTYVEQHPDGAHLTEALERVATLSARRDTFRVRRDTLERPVAGDSLAAQDTIHSERTD